MGFTGKFTKVAWVHDGEVGKPSPGHFNCPCGNVISGVEYAGPDDHPCRCGRVWDSRGWLVSEPPDGTLSAGLKAARQGEGLLGW
jgi:hypothetical protein